MSKTQGPKLNNLKWYFIEYGEGMSEGSVRELFIFFTRKTIGEI